MSGAEPPSGLLEVAPGDGWLARERDRIVWIPHRVDPDTAHACIEPLLLAPTFEESMLRIRSWPAPSFRFALIQLGDSMRVVSSGFAVLRRGARVELDDADVTTPPTAAVHALPIRIRQLRVPGPGEPSSGMLVEGVVRAGAWRWHTPASAGRATPKWQLDGSFGRVPLTQNLFIGRPVRNTRAESTPDFVGLADPTVSRSHAVVLVDNNGPKIVDSRSRNGTWVVPRAARKPVEVHDRVPYRLADGDAVVIGESWFVCHRLD